jgi:hypothetical protein
MGDDLRQQGRDPLPHFELRHRNGHHPVGRDLEPGAEHLLTLRRYQRAAICAR